MSALSPVAASTLLPLSHELLELSRQEEWDRFSTRSEAYLTALASLIAAVQQTSCAVTRQAQLDLLQQLQANDEEIAQRLQARLTTLSETMSRLQQSKKCSQDYAAQMPRPLFPFGR